MPWEFLTACLIFSAALLRFIRWWLSRSKHSDSEDC